jgi:hypothetical protein
MPELDGPTFSGILRRQYPSLCHQALCLTGALLRADRTAFLEQCGQPYLVKPGNAAEGRSVMGQVLHAPEPSLPGLPWRGTRHEPR